MIGIHRAGVSDMADWLALRVALWPDTAPESPAEIRDILDSADLAAFIARDSSGAALGLAEAALRRDYVNGCDTSPVGFVEGIYVTPAARQQGVAAALVAAVADWARGLGCTELASDAALDIHASHQMHAALGFNETERVVYFRRLL